MKRWQVYSQDPNDPVVTNLRRDAIARIRTGRLIGNRVQYLCDMAAGKSVLDVGVVNHTLNAADTPDWLHGNLRRHASRCLGVDVLEPEIAKLRALGFDALCADLTREPLPMKFDLIIGGEVLEHLDAPGMFMRNCSSMLCRGGRLVITVPNPWYANVILASLWKKSALLESADHVAWHEAATLYELAQRHDMELVSATGIGETNAKGWLGKSFFAARPALIGLGLSPELFAKSMLYEFLRT